MKEPKYAYVLKRLHRVQLLRTINCRRATADIDMHIRQMPMLEYIIEHENCTQVEIAEALGISAQSVAISTKRMSSAGLIDKRIDTDNLRCKRLIITNKGRELCEQCRSRLDELDERMCDGISDDALTQLCETLDKLISNLSDDVLSNLSIFDLRQMVCGDENKDKKE